MNFRRIVHVGIALSAACPALAKEMIPHERFTLPNGLRVLVHEDHKVPIVAVRVVYHVGAKDEPAGKTGFAHLFEHLMFKGSENFKGEFLQALDDVGATHANGITNQDTTQYFETVPTPALERVLWLESDRMGYLPGNITDEMLKTERGVVQNEKREREGGPLGVVSGRISLALFPEGHPYRRSVIGSMEDLDAASVDDVKGWFRRYYGATNTVVVLAGDIDLKTARALMEKYFSDMPAGEPLYRLDAWVPELDANIRETLQARVAQGALQRFWPTPGTTTRDHALLRIAASILSGTLEDRLHGEIVEKHQLATAATAHLEALEIAGTFSIGVDVKPSADVAMIERLIDEQVARFIEAGPTRKELRRIQDDIEAFQFLGLQSVSAKAELLADGEVLAGDATFNDRILQWMRDATPAQVRDAARRWLGKPHYQLTIHPFGEHEVAAPGLDRSVMPSVGGQLDVDLPPMQEATLSNGMRIVLAERHDVPSVTMSLVFRNAGANAGKLGSAVSLYALMNRGPAGWSELDYVERLQDLHASIRFDNGGRDASASLAVLKKNLRPALGLWERALREPALRAADLQEFQEDALQSISNARTQAGAVGGRILGKALYPPGHPLAPRDDEEQLIRALDMADLRAFHAKWIRPDNAKLFVVGDTSLPELTRELEKVFGDWKPPAEAIEVVAPFLPATVPTHPRFILVDWPDGEQTQISAGRFVLPSGSDDAPTLSAANSILGGGTTARLGQRLRVEKGWSYGINSGTNGGTVQQYWGIDTSVQGDKTAESVVEILDVIANLNASQPATDAELARYVTGQARSLPGMFEDASAVLGAMVQSDYFGRPYDWAEGARARLEALKLDDVNRIGREYFTPQSFTWVLVGDLSKFEQKLRELNPGAVEVWDREGRPVRR